MKRQNRARFKSGFLIDQSMLERYSVGFAAYDGWGLIWDRSPGAGAEGGGATAAMVTVFSASLWGGCMGLSWCQQY